MRVYHFILTLATLALPMITEAQERKLPEYDDDLYGTHDKVKIAARREAEAQAQQAAYAVTATRMQGSTTSYDFNSVLADTYESAYARRLNGFSSPTYRMPASYYTYRNNDAFFYASAYDPALYNVMVSGDEVWVEPKYITSMFGSWGAVVVPTYSWYYDWAHPYWGWGYPYRYRWNYYWSVGFYDPFFAWGWGYPYYPHYHYYPHHHHPSHRPHYPSHPHGGVGNSGHYIPGRGFGRNPGAAAPTNRVGTVSRPSAPSGRNSSISTRGTRPSSSQNGGSSTYRGGGSTYRSNSSGSSYRSNSSSFGGGSFSGGSHGGGSFSGGSHGGGNPLGR